MLMMLMPGREIPAGTHLEIRLTCAVGTYASQAGSVVSAVLTAPVMDGDQVLLAAGTSLAGTVKSVRRVGLGIVHETSAIELVFDSLETRPMSARVIEVDNARETVGRDGRISAIRATGSLSNRTTGYIRMAVGANLHAQLGMWAVKSLVVDVPEAEIYYPAGVELTLALTESFAMTVTEKAGSMPRTFTEEEHTSLDHAAAAMPGRTTNRSHHASDPINLMFVGSREQLAAAFEAAGWTETPQATLRSHLRNIRAVLENEGNRAAPMSTLLLDGEAADMMWQKGLNDVAKRHHIRIWKAKENWNGKEVWLGAATHDVDLAYFRPGMPVTHRIAGKIDRERDKVVHDLEFASAVEAADWIERAEASREMHNATGDRMTTDGRLAVVRLKDRPVMQFMVSFPHEPLAAHGKLIERFARREILSMRNELLRNNSYWRGYEAIRFALSAARRHKDAEVEVASAEPGRLGRVAGFVALR
jgi:hypothetical protein